MSVGDVVRPATLVRLRGLGPEALSIILARTTGLTILLAIMIAPNRALPGDALSNVRLRS